ncbi:two-component hybrid sensor and regulator [Nostoc sp. NIES-3756]|uniref:PAS domain S-box protein n=1 Tax=Nostoc sp. NIES-3756 TaxID=1751286 RepID=UPI00071FFEC4|nr:PAS domain S-box protein [Nostoc sp. NIES-3756]BAT53827.1 two-component hybrid sensor and regulator [Nostoc sp. NIES-3756]
MKTRQELELENITLRNQVQVLEETFRAIKMGEVDALVVSSTQGDKIFTLQDADYPYRAFLQEMHEGAVTVDEHGTILYCNHPLAIMLKKPLEKVIGSKLEDYIASQEKQVFQGLFQQARQEFCRGEVYLIAEDETQIPVYLSFKPLQIDEVAVTCIVVTNLTEQKRNVEIVAAEKLANSILEQAGEAIIVCDQSWQIIRANQAAQELCGNNPLFQQFDLSFPLQCHHCSCYQKIEECLFIDKSANGQQKQEVFSLSSLMQGQYFKGVEVLLTREDGSELNLLLSATPLLNLDNQVIGSVVTLTNITERKQTEEKIAKLVIREQAACAEAEATKNSLSNILESISDAFIAVDTNWCYTYVNQKAAEIIGKKVKDLIGKNIWQESPELISQNYYNDYLQALNEQRFIQVEKFFPSSQRWFEKRIYPSIQGVSIFFKDITREKQTEIALQESEERLRLALEAAQIGTWDWNIFTNHLKWSTRQEQLFGITPGTFRSSYEAFLACVHPEDREVVHQAVMGTKDNKSEYYVEYRVIWTDGSIHWIGAKGECIYDDEGTAVRMLGTCVDITQRKEAEAVLQQSKAELEIKVAARTAELSQANIHLHGLINILTITINQQTKIEAQLREAERRWRSLLENVQLLVIGLDKTGKVEYVNPFFLELSGYTQEEILGKDWTANFIPQHQQHDMQKVFVETLEQELHSHHQSQIITKSQEERVIAWNNTLLQDSQGAFVGTMSIGEDITQRYALEKIKNEFISVVSHELRTPMTSIQGGLNLLKTGLVKLDSEQGKRIIKIVSESSERLVRLVNDILDLERLQSGKITLNKQQVNAADLLTEATELMQIMANNAEINLSVKPQPVELIVDKDRIIQVLTNLLSNAIKFSPQGSTVSMMVEEIKAKDGQTSDVLFKVQDQGRGIPADKIESIFERFHQVDASDSRKQGGTGLGLAICRNIVEQHNGQIWVESTIGKGSIFYVKLPLNFTNNLLPKP